MEHLRKYPRTPHIEGSRLQAGDDDLDVIRFATLVGKHLVVEEKLDGANCGISFGGDGELRLQSRGHYLTGGPRERQFNLFKQWATVHTALLFERLEYRLIAYGEWMYPRHTMFYDQLPHYFIEFDVFDTESGQFLDSDRRAELWQDAPIVSAPTLHRGPLASLEELTALIGPSRFIRSGHRDRLREWCERQGLDAEQILRETNPGLTMEGVYVKVEEQGVVTERCKYVRGDFLTAVEKPETHFLSRTIVPNQLAEGVDIFAGA